MADRVAVFRIGRAAHAELLSTICSGDMASRARRRVSLHHLTQLNEFSIAASAPAKKKRCYEAASRRHPRSRKRPPPRISPGTPNRHGVRR